MTPTQRRTASILLLVAFLAAGCGLLPAVQAPADSPTAAASAPGLSQVVFRVVAPAGTATDSGLLLQVMDPVTGFAYNTQVTAMQSMGDGSWQASLSLASGSVIDYR